MEQPEQLPQAQEYHQLASWTTSMDKWQLIMLIVSMVEDYILTRHVVVLEDHAVSIVRIFALVPLLVLAFWMGIVIHVQEL
jgi:hypothetical protein